MEKNKNKNKKNKIVNQSMECKNVNTRKVVLLI